MRTSLFLAAVGIVGAGCGLPTQVGEVEAAGSLRDSDTSGRWYGVDSNKTYRVHYYFYNMSAEHELATQYSIDLYNRVTALDFRPGPLVGSNPDLTDSEPHILYVDFLGAASNTNGYQKLADDFAADPNSTEGQLFAMYGSMIRPASGARREDVIIRYNDTRPMAVDAALGSHVPLHETGHALGLMHEQQREDFATVIDYFPCCVTTDREKSFATVTGAVYLSPYDLSSIMQYASTTACATIPGSGGVCSCFPIIAKNSGEPYVSPAPISNSEPQCSSDTNSPRTGNGYQILETPTFSAEDRNVFYQMYPAVLGTDEADDLYGAALASGDFDGDGYADLAVGAPGEKPGSAAQAGSVYIYKGTYTGLMPWRRIDEPGGGTADDQFGYALRAGDLDGDGLAELIVSAPRANLSGVGRTGAVYVFTGSIEGPTTLESTLTANNTGFNNAAVGDWFGETLVLGDFNGDGAKEIVVGAPKKHLVYVIKRTGTGYTKYADAWGNNRVANDEFGIALATGDIDGDGAEELAIGSPERLWGTKSGKVYVARGQLAGGFVSTLSIVSEPVTSPAAGDEFGAAVAIGAFNPFVTTQSLAVGAPGRNNAEGRAFRFNSGLNFTINDGFTLQVSSFGVANLANARFGESLKAASLDGQGGDELAVGAPGWFGTGLVAIYRGKETTSENVLTPEVVRMDPATHGTPTTGQRFGNALAAGDVNNSGRKDLIVGEVGRASEAGAAWVMEGKTGAMPNWTTDETKFSTFFSQSSLSIYRR